jgi:cellulose biosynthesis protein BcsQ
MPREFTPSTRQSQPSDRFKRYAIVMEGQKQEPNYFKALKEYYTLQHRESRIIVKIVERKLEERSYSSPKYLIQHSQEISEKYELQEYDELWIVFDADSWKNKAFEELQNWKQQENYYYLAYNNPCFELWLILHLTEYQTIKEKLEAAKVRERSRLSKQILESFKQKYKLSGSYHQYMLRIPQAIERASALDITPEIEFPEKICTRVYRLVEKLTTLPKKNAFFNPDSCHNEKEVESKFIVSYLLPALGYRAGDWQQEVSGNRVRLDFFIYNLVIEAKHPNVDLTEKHVKQLKRYLLAQNACYGVLTNAQELRIYEQVSKLTQLVFRCFVKGIENKIPEINQLIGKNTLNPENKALKKFNHPPSTRVKKKQNDMKIIGIYHNKGGVGKTTIAVNLAAAFRNMGKRVLLIDIDAQANATFATGLIKFVFDKDDDLRESNVFKLLGYSESGFISEIRRQSHLFNEPEIDVIPSHITLIDKQSELTAFAKTRWRLHSKIQQVKQEYDIVIIDAPPSRDIYAEMTLIAADYLIIPSDLKPFANQGLPNVRNFIRQADETRISIGKEALKVIGVLPSKILPNPKYLKHTFEKQKRLIIQHYNFAVMNSKILDRPAKLASCLNKDIETAELRIPDPKSIFMFDKNSESAREFNELANEVLEKIGVTQ